MAQSLARVNLHIIFSTKERQPFIHPSIEKEMHGYLAGTCQNLKCIPFEVGGVEDHVHLLVSLSKVITISDLIEKIKVSSSKWIKAQDKQFRDFSWQKGYGVFSVDEPAFENVREYILRQREHHTTKDLDFKSEFLKILKRYNVSYDEKYLWD